MKKAIILTVFIAIMATVGCAPGEKTLWNGKDFRGWKLFVPDESVDVQKVWSVKDGVIRCEGKPNGYMRTEASYSNYKLHIEWRWVEGEYPNRNSGVLLHISVPDKVWPKCIEAQLWSGDAGDFWVMNGTGITADGKRVQSEPKAQRSPKKHESSEKPIGQWNSCDIYCKGDSIRCVVNGVVQNECTKASVTSGMIGLQSEGVPIEFRNIHIMWLQ